MTFLHTSDWKLCWTEYDAFGAFSRSNMNNKHHCASLRIVWKQWLFNKLLLAEVPLFSHKISLKRTQRLRSEKQGDFLFSIFFLFQRSLSNNASSCVFEEHPPARGGNTSTQNNVHSKRQHTAAHFPDSFPYLSASEIMEARGSRLASRVAPWLAATQLPPSLANQWPFT